MSVDFKIDQYTQELAISVSGHFNFSLVSEFRNIYACIESPKKITIDFKQTDVIDSSGLGILLYLQKHFDCDKENICLVNCNAAISKTFAMAQFSKLFTFS